MNLQKIDSAISDPQVPAWQAALFSAGVAIPADIGLSLLAKLPITPERLAVTGILAAAAGAGVNMYNRKFHSNEFDEWRKDPEGYAATHKTEKINDVLHKLGFAKTKTLLELAKNEGKSFHTKTIVTNLKMLKGLGPEDSAPLSAELIAAIKANSTPFRASDVEITRGGYKPPRDLTDEIRLKEIGFRTGGQATFNHEGDSGLRPRKTPVKIKTKK